MTTYAPVLPVNKVVYAPLPLSKGNQDMEEMPFQADLAKLLTSMLPEKSKEEMAELYDSIRNGFNFPDITRNFSDWIFNGDFFMGDMLDLMNRFLQDAISGELNSKQKKFMAVCALLGMIGPYGLGSPLNPFTVWTATAGAAAALDALFGEDEKKKKEDKDSIMWWPVIKLILAGLEKNE